MRDSAILSPLYSPPHSGRAGCLDGMSWQQFIAPLRLIIPR